MDGATIIGLVVNNSDIEQSESGDYEIMGLGDQEAEFRTPINYTPGPSAHNRLLYLAKQRRSEGLSSPKANPHRICSQPGRPHGGSQ